MIGDNIKKLRLENGFTQAQLAQELSVSTQAVSKWENNLSTPDIYLLTPLARCLGVTVDFLLQDGAENAIPAPAENAETVLKTWIRLSDTPTVTYASLFLHNLSDKTVRAWEAKCFFYDKNERLIGSNTSSDEYEPGQSPLTPGRKHFVPVFPRSGECPLSRVDCVITKIVFED